MIETTLSPLMSGGFSAGFLVVENGSLSGQRFALPPAPGVLLLGRERVCHVRFDPDRDRVVGRTHARIEVRHDGIYLVDLSSANGTFCEGGVAVRGVISLTSGMRFQLGGEGGPWLSVQCEVSNQAVHIAPSGADTLMLIPPASVQPPPEPTPNPALPPRLFSDIPMEAPVAAPPVLVVDPVAMKHRQMFVRQVVIISLLFALACGLGVLLGQRDGGFGSGESEQRAESR